MKIKHIIFDLDGTLIDSSSSILESFSRVFKANSIVPSKPLNSSIIGPPLIEVLELLSEITDKEKLNFLAEEFKSDYDNIGYKGSKVFPGINEMLLVLKQHKFKIYIATNKRILPTKKIINHCNWNNIFKGIYSLDSFSPSLTSKIDVLRNIIELTDAHLDEVLYVGDIEGDRVAAIANNISFLMAEWGYGKKNQLEIIDKDAIPSPIDLINILSLHQ